MTPTVACAASMAHDGTRDRVGAAHKVRQRCAPRMPLRHPVHPCIRYSLTQSMGVAITAAGCVLGVMVVVTCAALPCAPIPLRPLTAPRGRPPGHVTAERTSLLASCVVRCCRQSRELTCTLLDRAADCTPPMPCRQRCRWRASPGSCARTCVPRLTAQLWPAAHETHRTCCSQQT